MLASLFRQLGLVEAAVPLFIVCALALLGGLAFSATFRADPETPDIRAAFVLAATFTVLVSPPHAWYLLWLIPFLCFTPSPAVLYLTLAAIALYRVGWPPSLFGAAFLYVPFASWCWKPPRGGKGGPRGLLFGREPLRRTTSVRHRERDR